MFIFLHFCIIAIYVYHILDVADARDTYDKIRVSEPAILRGRVTFTITLKRTCLPNNWKYTFNNTEHLFYEDDSISIGEVNNTYTLTLVNAAPTYKKTNILFYCNSQVPVDTVTLDLIGK